MSQVHPPRSHDIHSRVRSFSRAGGRLTDAQARALERHGRRYVVEVPRADAIRTVDPSFRLDPERAFRHVGQVRPLVIEAGAGVGEAILAHAADHPGVDHLAVEVWQTAIASLVRSIAERGLNNVMVAPADASQLLATALPVACASEVWVFFPDPWRKARHRKRRLVTPRFADAVARVLRPGGVWRLATDWSDYAWQMRDVLEAVSALPVGLEADMTAPYFRYDDAGARPDLGAEGAEEGSAGNGIDPGSPSGVVGGWSERFAGRVITRFETKGVEAGRTVRDLTAVRTETLWTPARSEAMLVALERAGALQTEADDRWERMRPSLARQLEPGGRRRARPRSRA